MVSGAHVLGNLHLNDVTVYWKKQLNITNSLWEPTNQRLQVRILHRWTWLKLKTLAICSDIGLVFSAIKFIMLANECFALQTILRGSFHYWQIHSLIGVYTLPVSPTYPMKSPRLFVARSDRMPCGAFMDSINLCFVCQTFSFIWVFFSISIPRCSMYGIFTYIYPKNHPVL